MANGTIISGRVPKMTKPVTISGSPGDDAKQYQIKAVRSALQEAKRER